MTNQFFGPSSSPWSAWQRVTPTGVAEPTFGLGLRYSPLWVPTMCNWKQPQLHNTQLQPCCYSPVVSVSPHSVCGREIRMKTFMVDYSKWLADCKKPVKPLAMCSLQVTCLKMHSFSTHLQVHLNISIPLMFILVTERNETFYSKTFSVHLGDSITSEEKKFHSQSLLGLSQSCQ